MSPPLATAVERDALIDTVQRRRRGGGIAA